MNEDKARDQSSQRPVGERYMRMAMLCAVSLLWIDPVLADNQSSANFPILGYVAEGLLYVPTYKEEHGKIPGRLFAYGGGKEFVATLRKSAPFRAVDDKHDCYETWRGQYIYETQPTTGSVRVIVFDTKMSIQSDDKKMYEAATHTEWDIIRLTSHEGGHNVLRTIQNGECISHIDYYTYCSYATEADSDQAFQAAMCGKRTNESDTGF